MFFALANNVYEYLSSLDSLVVEEMAANESTIIRMNRDQLSIGMRSDDTEIEPQLKSKLYADEKIEKGGKAPRYTPDLKDTGDFYRGFKVEKTEDSLSITSSDEKTEALKSKYSEDIFGLNNKNLGELSPKALKILQNEFGKITKI